MKLFTSSVFWTQNLAHPYLLLQKAFQKNSQLILSDSDNKIDYKMVDYYEVLEVSKTAPGDEIKKA